jgi:hypothetical protein
MTSSNNASEAVSLSFDEQTFPFNPNNTGISPESARSWNFTPTEPTKPLITPPPPPPPPPPPAKERPAPVADAREEMQDMLIPMVQDGPPIARDELIAVMGSFVRAMRAQPTETLTVELKNKNTEIGQLKELLLEAQETIIQLLNDRVLDRSKIAKLEAEVRLLPDLQSQANRAMGLAIRSEDVEKELAEVRAEVERLRTSYMKAERGFLGWIFGRKVGP